MKVTPRQVRAALKRLRLSQSEAARRLGVQQSTMYRWLAGERKIPGPVAAAITCWLAVLTGGSKP
jgi:transcriptional regulator with XRE-family HTH domain